ncbi:hypothetical protein KP808_21130 [Pseudomonas savastanoi]|uniref:Uncharacterized protein n=1 Tax=Pseudomonas savastanoi TaxID=29438 RepID=A0AAW3M2C3_PSESS|nr:hypothetical protein AO287_13615 [Pseudomonas savastanoi]QXW44253.1 hypothetical protein KXJ79_21680 [Pseudomonas amygdali]UFI44246.1 hypothetical protein KP808_21130 [Pseudomonas savastanoi]
MRCIDPGFHAIGKFSGFLPTPALDRVFVQFYNPSSPMYTFFNSDEHCWHLLSVRVSLCRVIGAKADGRNPAPKIGIELQKITIPDECAPFATEQIRAAFQVLPSGQPDAKM